MLRFQRVEKGWELPCGLLKQGQDELKHWHLTCSSKAAGVHIHINFLKMGLTFKSCRNTVKWISAQQTQLLDILLDNSIYYLLQVAFSKCPCYVSIIIKCCKILHRQQAKDKTKESQDYTVSCCKQLWLPYKKICVWTESQHFAREKKKLMENTLN